MITRRTTLGLLAAAFAAGIARGLDSDAAYFKDKIAAGELDEVEVDMASLPV